MTSQFDVIGIGAAIVDVIGRVDDAFLETHELPKGAMTLVDSARADAIHADMGADEMVSGGSAANTIAGLGALGARTAFIGKTKQDDLGAIFAREIRSVGAAFETPPFGADASSATARSMILVTPDAQRTMCTDLGVSGLLTADDLPRAQIEASEILYLEGYLWDRDDAKAAFRAAAETARAATRKVALTLSDPFCVERHRASFLELLPSIDILFANEIEALSLYQTNDFDAAAAQISAACDTVAVTRSEKGAVAFRKGETAVAPAAAIEKLVDTTGAGDLFAAGFLRGVTLDAPLETCARMGCAAAAEVIQHLGARPASDLKAVLARAGLPTG